MFPNVDGFHWSAGHLIFLGIFFAVVSVIVLTVLLALARARRDARTKKADSLRWLSDFHDLPERDRVCRHELTGEFAHRTCDRAFDCRGCEMHAKLSAAAPAPAAAAAAVGVNQSAAKLAASARVVEVRPFGLEFPDDRLYHRGHTWVRQERDGTMAIGLDDFASRLAGTPDAVILPSTGESVTANGTAWRMRRSGVEVRILAPIDGEVVATGGPSAGYYLKVKPANPDTSHLLRGAEVQPWLARELDRLQMLISTHSGLPALADGGVLVDDLPAACPQADWDNIWGQIFLHP